MHAVNAFYLPGVAPMQYLPTEEVDLKVNKLDSIKTQLPYDYYSLPFCRPAVIEEAVENLGEVLSGDLIETSLYHIQMKVSAECKVLCRSVLTDDELGQFASKIRDEYRINWLVDNLPAATQFFTTSDAEDEEEEVSVHYEKGFPLGFVGPQGPNSENEVAYINNHVHLKIFYHEEKDIFQGSRIVGFEVEPFSIKHEIKGQWDDSHTELKTCPLPERDAIIPQRVSNIKDESDKTIIWTYTVQWQESPIKWASRWDLYLKMTDSQIHWFSITNSIMIVLFLTGMVAMIMMRTLHRDVARYNADVGAEEDQIEETGWKLIHGDVFRTPAHGGFLSILVGTGVQIFAMTLLTLIFAVLGFLSPANRGGLMTALLLLFVFMGVFAILLDSYIQNVQVS